MDLAEYEEAKFELAAILRSAEDILRERQPDIHGPFQELFARLAEDRFNLVVVGRFSRGKTSLMNAMLDTERLPTGLVPLTSVITTVSYGSRERVFIEHEGWTLETEIPLEDLPKYVTQQHNPGNERGVTVARVELPSELLRRGFHFVDTPGLGSSILENTRTTERFLPQADAFVLVTSYDSPLSEEELRVLQGVALSSNRLFLVVNKHDTVTVEEREQVLQHVRDQARRVFGESPPQVFSVSARDAIDANKHRDRERYADSGMASFREEVVRFLLTEKQADFLLRMCERVDEALRDIPNVPEQAERLRALHRRLGRHRPNVAALSSMADPAAQFSSCWICARLDRGIFDFLCQYQYDLVVRNEVQSSLAKSGGLCAVHTWRYAKIASARGTCVGFAGVLDHLARRLRTIAETSADGGYPLEIEKLRPTAQTCRICCVQKDIESAAVESMAGSIRAGSQEAEGRFSGLCLDHLRLVLQALGPGEVAKKLLVEEADILERVCGDLRRYALKRDGVRRSLVSAEEHRADERALMLLAGHRNLNVV